MKQLLLLLLLLLKTVCLACQTSGNNARITDNDLAT